MFDFARFHAAVEALDAERWLAFFADDAEWVEYRNTGPPSSPRVTRGRDAILRDGLIARQHEVEAWD